MSAFSYIRAYLSGPSLYRIYRQARLVSTTIYKIAIGSIDHTEPTIANNNENLNIWTRDRDIQLVSSMLEMQANDTVEW